jgi:hypothetical protein
MVKTTKRNQLFVVQKKVRGAWNLIEGSVFNRRSHARQLSNELNNLVPKAGRGRNRRYRVAKMIVEQKAVSCQATAIP